MARPQSFAKHKEVAQGVEAALRPSPSADRAAWLGFESSHHRTLSLRTRPTVAGDRRTVRDRIRGTYAVDCPAAEGDRRRTRLPLVFKASFDKANRTSGDAFRGLGLERRAWRCWPK